MLQRDLVIVTLATVGCGLLAFFVTRFGWQEGSVSAVRLSSAWLLGILLLYKPGTLGACLVLFLGWIALAVGVHFASNFSWGLSIGLGGARALEAALPYVLLRRLHDPAGLRSLQDLGWLGLATLIAPAIAGMLGAGLTSATAGVAALPVWRDWWVAGAFGMLTLLPLMLSATPDRLRSLRQPRFRNEFALLAVFTLIIAVAAAMWLSRPFVLLTLPLLWAAFRIGAFGTAALNLLTVTTLLVLYRQMPAEMLHGLVNLDFGDVAFYSALSLIPPLLVSVLQEQRRAARHALQDALDQLRLITDNVPAIIGRLDREGRYRFVNRRFAELLGKDPDALLGLTPGEALSMGAVDDKAEEALAGKTVHFEALIADHDLDVTYVPQVVAGEVLGFFVLGHDVTRRKAAERALHEEKERLHVTLDSIGDAVVACDAGLRITLLNPVAEDMTGWREAEALGRPLDEVVRLIDLTSEQPPLSPLAIAMQDNRIVAMQMNTALERRDGMRSPIEDSAAPIHDGEGRVVGGVMVFHDVSESRAMALKMSHQAQHDYLTDLPNRILMHDRLSQALATAGPDTSGAVLFIDLDHFKTINDSLGHQAGDLVLQEVARRLVRAVRPDDTVSRQGGDEFVVLLARLHDPRDAARVAENMMEAMQAPIEVAGHHKLHVGLSIGIALFPQDAVDTHSLMMQADTALYHAKHGGRGRYSYFAASMSEQAQQRLLLEHDLRDALRNDELFLVYQPKVMRPDGDITGMEALVRWRRNDGRVVPPLEFIPIAEECGLVGAIDAWVMREACRQNKAWQDGGMPALPVSVNVSLMRLDSTRLLALVSEVLEQTGLAPNCLEIEFTESQMFSDETRAGDLIEGLRALRVRLAVDDFGTGYSNLKYLAQYAFDTIKIDRSFIVGLPEDSKQNAVVQAIVSMAAALNARVVAEGVETLPQAQALELHGCHEIQGYLYCHPLSADELLPLLRRGTLEEAPKLGTGPPQIG